MFKKWFLPIIMLGLFFICQPQKVQAVGEPYVIDQAPTKIPKFEDYTIVPVSTFAQLSSGLSNASQTNVIYELQNDINMTSRVNIQGNKAINLNGHLLSASTSGHLLVPSGSSTKQFKIYNGRMSGGPRSTHSGSETTENSAFFNINRNTLVDVVFEDISYESYSNGGMFFYGLGSNIFSLGKITMKTYLQHYRAGNMTFYGDFNGLAFGNNLDNEYGESTGGLNLSFGGYAYSYRNKFNNGNETMTNENGDRRIYIGKDAHVVLKNTNNQNWYGYNNNIGNFSVLNVDGYLEAEAVGTSLRTTASTTNNKKPYDNLAGTYNGMANITVNEGASFKISSTSTDPIARWGALYTYNTNIYAYKPKMFDMRYFSNGNFFYVYPPALGNVSEGNMYLYDQNIGVWLKDDRGIGNPTQIWQNVSSMSIINFSTSSPGVISSSDSTLNNSTFVLNNYSRISNDVRLPMIVPDDQFIDSKGNVFFNNGDTVFSGSTDYYLPGDVRVGKPAVNATVTFNINGTKYTTKTDSEGKWSFTGLNFSNIKAGTTGTLDITDVDQRYGPQITVTLKDTTPPKATPKLIKVLKDSTTGLKDPKEGVGTYSDETTSKENIKIEFVTSDEDRAAMLTERGVYEVDIDVTDEAGNTTTVTTPVVVYSPGETITTGFVVGKDFEIDYKTWLNATDAERKQFILDAQYGAAKGYTISGDTVTEVTNDPTKTIITIPNNDWKPKKTYQYTVKVNSYSQTFNVTLVPSTVNMTVKQVYKNTDNAIYSNLSSKTLVDNTKVYEETIDDEFTTIINNKISSGEFKLNYEGYEVITVTDYKIYQNNQEVIPTPTVVPDEDFTIVYNYEGQLRFKDNAIDLDFGSIPITSDKSITKLSDTSQDTIAIIDTIPGSEWRLKLALPEGINKTDGSQDEFLGNVLYRKSGAEEDITIEPEDTLIETKQGNDLLNHLDLKNGEYGMLLQQNVGNLKGSYQGKLVWTLEDSP